MKKLMSLSGRVTGVSSIPRARISESAAASFARLSGSAFPIEELFRIADAECRGVALRVPGDRDVGDREIPSVGAGDDPEHERAILARAAHGTDAVQA